MNKNEVKTPRNQKGLVDPKSIKEFKVYVETTLLEFLLFKMTGTSRNTVKSLLSHHLVAVDGVPVSQFDYKLYPEDTVIVSKRPIHKRKVAEFKILLEDEDIIAIDKPSGLLSVATDREKGKTAFRMVSDYYREKNPKGRIHLVHRLDQDTSGVLIFAKSHETREALQNAWQDIVTKRYYYAIVDGHMEKSAEDLADYLYQDSCNLMRITKNKSQGKLAITHYQVARERGPYTLLKVAIDSGRKNQIRVQLGHIGHNVIGDDKYGEPSNPLKRLGLHAYELAFTNPLTHRSYDIVSPMPEEFKTLMFEDAAKKAPSVEEKPARKPTRPTRSATKIAKGKKRQAERNHYGPRKGKRA